MKVYVKQMDEALKKFLKNSVKDNKVKILEIPKKLEKSLIKKSEVTLEELEKFNEKDLENIFLEFEPNLIFGMDFLMFNEKLIENIFFKVCSEYCFSPFSKELTDSEYKRLTNFLINKENDKLKIKIEDLIGELSTIMFIIKRFYCEDFKPSLKEKINKKILKSIEDINYYKKEIKNVYNSFFVRIEREVQYIAENYLEKVDNDILLKCEEIELSIAVLETLKAQLLPFNVKMIFSEMLADYFKSDGKIKIKKSIDKLWEIKQEKLILMLDSEEEDFTINNIEEKMIKYFEYLSEKGILINTKEEDFFNRLDENIILNYLKLFFFCSRPNEFIEVKEFLTKLENYTCLEKYIMEYGDIFFEKKELCFNLKVKNLLLMFEEKVLSFPVESIEKLGNEKLKILREKSYSKINEEYVKNILEYFDGYKKLFKEKWIVLSKDLEREIEFDESLFVKKLLTNLNLEEIYEVIKTGSKEILKLPNEHLKVRKYFSFKEEYEEYLEEVKKFAFSNVKRTGIYYRLLLLNILSNLDSEKLSEYLKENGKVSDNYKIYFSDLKKNKKKLGKKHLEYILNFLKETDKDKAKELIFCINSINIYSEDNLLIDILDLEEYEKNFIYSENR